MAFTLTFTFTVTPVLIVLGLMIALGVNALSERIKGLVIFVSLLPMIVTPLIGSLILFWMIDSRGILGNAISGWPLIQTLSLESLNRSYLDDVDRLWSLAFSPFCLCCLLCRPADPYQWIRIESARIDGASRWEQSVM